MNWIMLQLVSPVSRVCVSLCVWVHTHLRKKRTHENIWHILLEWIARQQSGRICSLRKSFGAKSLPMQQRELLPFVFVPRPPLFRPFISVINLI